MLTSLLGVQVFELVYISTYNYTQFEVSNL